MATPVTGIAGGDDTTDEEEYGDIGSTAGVGVVATGALLVKRLRGATADDEDPGNDDDRGVVYVCGSPVNEKDGVVLLW